MTKFGRDCRLVGCGVCGGDCCLVGCEFLGFSLQGLFGGDGVVVGHFVSGGLWEWVWWVAVCLVVLMGGGESGLRLWLVVAVNCGCC